MGGKNSMVADILRHFLEFSRQTLTNTKRMKATTVGLFDTNLAVPSPPLTHHVPVLDCSLGFPLETFIVQYFEKSKPVVLKNLVRGVWDAVPSPSSPGWSSVDFWLRAVGHRYVPVEFGSYLSPGFDQILMSVEEYVLKYILTKQPRTPYLAQYEIFEQVPELEAGVLPLPDVCFLDDNPTKFKPVQRFLFLGPGGTISPLHTDPRHNLNTQIFGKKYFKLYAPEQYENLYAVGSTSNRTSLPSNLDLVDFSKFPRFQQAECSECVLQGGDALFLPRGWWHYVKGLSTSASIANFFGE
jgi:hypothetical protein